MYSSNNNIMISNDRLSAFGVVYHASGHPQGQEAEQSEIERSASVASTAMSGHTSILGSISSESESQHRQSVLLTPGHAGTQDSRLSEFYEAYYRNSHVGPAQYVETSQHTLDRQSVIAEVGRPTPTVLFSRQPGAAF
jgi:hypothetical protein